MKYTLLSYDQLIQQSYRFDAHTYKSIPENAMLKSFYEKSYLNSEGEDLIPRKIHQIWLGGEIPPKYKAFTDSWQKYNPGWEYKLWTDADARNFGMIREDLFYQSNNAGQRSDIFRHEILYREGGLYVDTDFECLRSFNDLLYLNYFTGIGYSKVIELYPALIGSTQGNPIVKSYIDGLVRVGKRDWREMFETTGPYYYTRSFLKAVNPETRGVVAFPSRFFYPWSNNKLEKDDNPYSHVKSYSYAIHHWAVSWSTKNHTRNGLDTGR